jgi:DNA-binding transcriptional LysR family regulator
LQLTPSAVTKRIQALERRVGGRLFERRRFGMRPDRARPPVYPAAKRALEALSSVAELSSYPELTMWPAHLSKAVSDSDTLRSFSFLVPGA